jgi:hypothetical protein
MPTIIKPLTSIRLAFALALSALLIGCGAATTSGPATAQPAAPTSAPQPATAATTAPTSVPAVVPTAPAAPTAEPTLAPTVEPTAAPVSEGLLPAPLYFVTSSPTEASHIVRIERDGKTRTALLDEAPAKEFLTITEFDVSLVDGSLVYIIQGQNGNSLIKTGPDGNGRTVLLADVSVNTPRWSPDGKTIAVGVFQASEAIGGLASGVYLIPAGGGAPKLLQANDPVADPANPSPEARGFAPKTWSPDGKQLLLGTFSLAVELCGSAVKDLATGELVDIAAPEGLAACDGGTWSADGSTIYIGMMRPGYLTPVPGLWRADAATGETTPYIVGESDQGIFTLVRGAQSLDDDSVYTLLGYTDTLPDPGGDPSAAWPQFALARVSADGARIEQLTDAIYENPGNSALLARDGSGAVVEQYDAQRQLLLLWLPADGGPPVTIAEDISASGVRWGTQA